MISALARHWPDLVLLAGAVLFVAAARWVHRRHVAPPKERLSAKWKGWPQP